MNIINSLISCFFPNVCAGCGEVLKGEDHFCDYCFEMMERVPIDKICKKCGLPKKNCDCGKYIFHFDSCVAPFRNDGVARTAMHKFKFNHKERLGYYFAEQMVLSIKQRYYEYDFDLITFVPMRKADELARGYNQSFVLANRISKILNIPLAQNILKCNKKQNKQHTLSRKDRFENIKGVFYCNAKLSGKRILLVDDIKTTGATLDACAKELYAAGADSVCCVTGLITYKDKDKNKKKGK